MNERTEHCAFKRLNMMGRCIAPCYLAKDGTDCTGATGKTMHHEQGREIPVCGRGRAKI